LVCKKWSGGRTDDEVTGRSHFPNDYLMGKLNKTGIKEGSISFLPFFKDTPLRHYCQFREYHSNARVPKLIFFIVKIVTKR